MPIVPQNSDPESLDAARKATSIGLNVLSKVFAILVLSTVVVVGGYYLDQWLGWRFFLFVGVLLSVVVAISGLFAIAKQANSELVRKRSNP